jgi:hypothetical protein
MREMTEPELTTRIRAFIDKKSAKFPDLQHSMRIRTIVPRSVLKNNEFDPFHHMHLAM